MSRKLTRERLEHALRYCKTPGEAARRLNCNLASLQRALKREELVDQAPWHTKPEE